jgi:hypothetical protein
MSVKKKLVAAGVAGAVALGGFTIGPALAQDVTSTRQPASSQPAPPQGEQGQDRSGGRWTALRQQRRAAFVEDVAKQLGVSVDELKTAAKAAHEAVVEKYGEFDRSSADPSAILERRHEFAQALADQLGVSVDKVEAAGTAAFTDGLDKAVTNGRLTQDQADQIAQHAQDGTLRGWLRPWIKEQVQKGDLKVPHWPGLRRFLGGSQH